MLAYEKRRIKANLKELVDTTNVTTTVIVYLQACNVLSKDDVSILDSEKNDREKVRKFYALIQTKKASYAHLIAAFDEGVQTGASRVLKMEFSSSEKNPIRNAIEDHSRLCWFGVLTAILAILAYIVTASEYYTTLSNAHQAPKIKQHKNSIRFNVQNPVVNFTGREKEMLEIHDKLQNGGEEEAIVSIVGLGGIGKTELVRNYIQKYGDHYDGNIIWISAETKDTLEKSFRLLATDYLKISSRNIDGDKKDIVNLIKEVYTHLEHNVSLFVFDNAEYTTEIRTFLPIDYIHVPSPPFVVITSRDTEWAFAKIKVNELAKQDSIDYVRRCLGISDNDGDSKILELITTLQNFPLALSQAVSYIKERQIVNPTFKISDYIRIFITNKMNPLNTDNTVNVLNTYRETTFTTWRITMQRISVNKNEKYGDLAIKILNIISFFHADDIPIDMLAAVDPDHQNGQEFAIKLLAKYSMVNIQRSKGTISVHRLVQEVTRDSLFSNNQINAILKQILSIFKSNISSPSHRFIFLDFINIVANLMFKSLVKEAIEFYLSIVEIFYSNYMYDEYISLKILSSALKRMPSYGIRVIKFHHSVGKLEYHITNNDGLESLMRVFEHCLKSCHTTTWGKEMIPIMQTYWEYSGDVFTSKPSVRPQSGCNQVLTEYCLGIRGEIYKAWPECFQEVATKPYKFDKFDTVDVLLYYGRCVRTAIVTKSNSDVANIGRVTLQTLVFRKGISSTDINRLKTCEILVGSDHLDFLEEISDRMLNLYEEQTKVDTTDNDWLVPYFDVAAFLTTICQYNIASDLLNDIKERLSKSASRYAKILELQLLYLMANLKMLNGDYKEGHLGYEEVKLAYTKILGSQHLETVLMTMRISDKLFEFGHFELALDGYRSILKKFPKNVPKPSWTMEDGTVVYERLSEIMIAAEASIKAYQESVKEENFHPGSSDTTEINDYIILMEMWKRLTDKQNRFRN